MVSCRKKEMILHMLILQATNVKTIKHLQQENYKFENIISY